MNPGTQDFPGLREFTSEANAAQHVGRQPFPRWLQVELQWLRDAMGEHMGTKDGWDVYGPYFHVCLEIGHPKIC